MSDPTVSFSERTPGSTLVVETVEPVPEFVPAVSYTVGSHLVQRIDAHPVALDMLLLKTYGVKWLSYEPVTVGNLSFMTKLGAHALSQANLQKVMACRCLHMVDDFWRRWEVFAWCTSAFFGDPPSLDVMPVPHAVQALLAVSYAGHIRKDVEWSDEVKAYMSTLFRHDGLFYPPPPCDFLEFDLAAHGLATYGSPPLSEEDKPVQEEQNRRRLTLVELLHTDAETLKSQLKEVEYV